MGDECLATMSIKGLSTISALANLRLFNNNKTGGNNGAGLVNLQKHIPHFCGIFVAQSLVLLVVLCRLLLVLLLLLLW